MFDASFETGKTDVNNLDEAKETQWNKKLIFMGKITVYNADGPTVHLQHTYAFFDAVTGKIRIEDGKLVLERVNSIADEIGPKYDAPADETMADNVAEQQTAEAKPVDVPDAPAEQTASKRLPDSNEPEPEAVDEMPAEQTASKRLPDDNEPEPVEVDEWAGEQTASKRLPDSNEPEAEAVDEWSGEQTASKRLPDIDEPEPEAVDEWAGGQTASKRLPDDNEPEADDGQEMPAEQSARDYVPVPYQPAPQTMNSWDTFEEAVDGFLDGLETSMPDII